MFNIFVKVDPMQQIEKAGMHSRQVVSFHTDRLSLRHVRRSSQQKIIPSHHVCILYDMSQTCPILSFQSRQYLSTPDVNISMERHRVKMGDRVRFERELSQTPQKE